MRLSRPQDFNIKLAEEVLDHLKCHPYLHNQKSIEYCVIGWAVRLSGGLNPLHFSCRATAQERLGLSTRETRSLFYTVGFFSERRALHKLAQMIKQAKRYWSNRENDLFGEDIDRRVLAQVRKEHQDQEWAEA